jgi:hypothetical protein
LELNYWGRSWPLRVRKCPCDLHFVEYLRQSNIGDRVIFHFGTGSHHIVGKTNAQAARPNEILGITASRREYAKYIDYIIANPAAAKYYKVIFADIYTLTPRTLPRFDLVTLFHLGEFYDERRSAYAPLDDSTLLDLFIAKLNRGGRILFYKFSGLGGAEKTRRILERATEVRKLVKEGEFKSLLIYRPAGPMRPAR